MKYYIHSLLVGEVLLWALGAGPVKGQAINYSGSVQYATGSYYFTEQTGSFYLNNGFGVAGDAVSIYLNVPFIAQNTPWVSYTNTGVGPLPTGGPHNRLVGGRNGEGNRRGRRIDPGVTDTLNFTETHFGDPSLSGSIKLYSSEVGRSSVNGNIGIKIPFTDASDGFGTGAWDVGAGVSWSQRVADTVLLVLSGMYWQLGDMDDLNFNNILSYSTAIGQTFQNGKLRVVANFFGSTQIIDDIDPPLSTGVGFGFQTSTNVSLNTNLLIGLTESASDFNIGAGWSIKL
ncbi:transporter [Fodinibius salsisoli]|uniref:Transporter n=1 Tax=Fodinibius salsisoli TaxID=2820877 RepID=A0ABT3PIE7_9BACT|nr:transporter [Fodinibius salsisoli]MCW9705711.1 transporter [Fodinibius salsisoli]